MKRSQMFNARGLVAGMQSVHNNGFGDLNSSFCGQLVFIYVIFFNSLASIDRFMFLILTPNLVLIVFCLLSKNKYKKRLKTLRERLLKRIISAI